MYKKTGTEGTGSTRQGRFSADKEIIFDKNWDGCGLYNLYLIGISSGKWCLQYPVANIILEPGNLRPYSRKLSCWFIPLPPDHFDISPIINTNQYFQFCCMKLIQGFLTLAFLSTYCIYHLMSFVRFFCQKNKKN